MQPRVHQPSPTPLAVLLAAAVGLLVGCQQPALTQAVDTPAPAAAPAADWSAGATLTAELKGAFATHGNGVMMGAVSPDSLWLAVNIETADGEHGSFEIWDLTAYQRVADNLTGLVYAFADNSYFVAAVDGPDTLVYRVPSGELVDRYPGYPVGDGFSTDSNFAVIAGPDAVTVYPLTTTQAPDTPDTEWAAAEDGSIWGVPSGQRLGRVNAADGTAPYMVESSGPRLIASLQNTSQVYTLPALEPQRSWPGTMARFLGRGDYILTTEELDDVVTWRVYPADDDRPLLTLHSSYSEAAPMMSRDNDLLVAPQSDTERAWTDVYRLPTAARLARFDCYDGDVDPSGRWFAAHIGGDGDQTTVYDLTSGALAAEAEGGNGLFLLDGRRLLTTLPGESLLLWEPAAPQE